MRFTTVFALAAATLVAAYEDQLTTTLTSTSTNYVTVTECGPEVPDCTNKAPVPTTTEIPSPPPVVVPPPVNTTTTTPSMVYPPPVNTPSIKTPTPAPIETTTVELPPSPPQETSTKIVIGTTTRPAESQPTAGAAGVVLQSGFLIAALAAAMAVVY